MGRSGRETARDARQGWPRRAPGRTFHGRDFAGKMPIRREAAMVHRKRARKSGATTKKPKKTAKRPRTKPARAAVVRATTGRKPARQTAARRARVDGTGPRRVDTSGSRLR